MILRRSVTKIWILTSLLALLFSSSAVGAEIKPGKSCSKVNVTKVLKGLKYTCIKSGKKLIWSKGVKFSSKPTTSPSSKSGIDLYTGVNQAIKPISASEEFSVQTSDGLIRMDVESEAGIVETNKSTILTIDDADPTAVTINLTEV